MIVDAGLKYEEVKQQIKNGEIKNAEIINIEPKLVDSTAASLTAYNTDPIRSQFFRSFNSSCFC